MTLSIAAAWTSAVTATGADLRYLVTITARNISSGAYSNFSCVSGQTTLFGYPNSIAKVEPFAFEIDPLTRTFSSGSWDVALTDDGWFRDLIATHYIRGKAVTVKLGERSLAENAFQTICVGVIDNMIPEYGQITLTVLDETSVLRDRDIIGAWVGQHPFDVMEDIIVRAGVPAAQLSDGSFHPTVDLTREHWCMSRADDYMTPSLRGAIKGPTSAKELLEELQQLTQSTVRPNEVTGKLTLYPYYDDAGVAASWTIADVADVAQVETWDRTINQVRVDCVLNAWRRGANLTPVHPKGDHGLIVDSEFAAEYQRIDANSQAFLGRSGVVATYSWGLQTPWVNGLGILRSPLYASSGPGDTFEVDDCGLRGFAGTRWDHPINFSLGTPAQAAGYALSATKLAYLLISVEANVTETISIDQIIPVTLLPGGKDYGRADELSATGVWSIREHYYRWRCRIAERGLFGSNPGHYIPGPAQAITRVIDVTIPAALSESIVSRFSMGCPILECHTTLAHMNLELGDFVRLTHALPLDHGRDGSNTAGIWEIVRKEIRPLDDSPGIYWRLAWVRYDSGAHVPSYTFGIYEPTTVAFTLITDDAGVALADEDGDLVNDGGR